VGGFQELDVVAGPEVGAGEVGGGELEAVALVLFEQRQLRIRVRGFQQRDRPSRPDLREIEPPPAVHVRRSHF
jgi:hypothetical protein